MDACFHTEKHGEKKRATSAKVYITDYPDLQFDYNLIM